MRKRRKGSQLITRAGKIAKMERKLRKFCYEITIA
jgi:hypothetical protein